MIIKNFSFKNAVDNQAIFYLLCAISGIIDKIKHMTDMTKSLTRTSLTIIKRGFK